MLNAALCLTLHALRIRSRLDLPRCDTLKCVFPSRQHPVRLGNIKDNQANP